jgi:hypothetical protein
MLASAVTYLYCTFHLVRQIRTHLHKAQVPDERKDDDQRE